MRYQASSWRGWTRTRRRWCQWGTKRRPLRSQTKSVSSQPASPCLLAGAEPVGDEDEDAVGERDAFGVAEMSVADGPEAELVEQGTDGEDGPPGRGIDDLGIGQGGVFLTDVATEQSLEFGEDVDEEVFAAEVGDDALLDLAVFAVGLDDADVFVESAAGGADFHGSRVHENHYHD